MMFATRDGKQLSHIQQTF